MGLSYHRCRRCGLLFAYPLPEQAAAQYDDPEYFRALALDTGDRLLLAMKIETARRRLAGLRAAGGRKPLLEVGCGTGLFLGEAGAMVPVGIDVSRVVLRLARDRHVHRLACASPDALPFHSGTFASVVMYDTLEHLAQPARALVEIARVLRPGGILHLTTPNAGGVAALLLGASFPHVNPEHVALFGRRALRRALAAAGLRVVRLRSVVKPLTLEYLRARLERYRVPMVTPAVASLARALPAFSRRNLLLPSGELEAVARKV